MSDLVLVVDDEQKIRDLLRRSFERAGFAVLTAAGGAEALELAERAAPAIVVLDLGLPDVPGDEVARELRERGDVPILVLTARSGEEDRIAALELGVDDYVAKPFSPREVILRVQAILRRGRGGAEAGDGGVVSFADGELRVDEARHEVTVRGDVVDLTPTEWGILTALAATPGRAFSRFELINRVRGYEFEGYERVIDSHVKNLRRKLERDPREPRIVQTVTGVGYRLGVRADA